MTELIHKKPRRARPSLRAAWKAASVIERRRFIAELLVDLLPRTPAPTTTGKSSPAGDATVDEFFARCVAKSAGDCVQSAALYESYRGLCSSLDQEPISHKAFSIQVSRRGFVRKQSSVIFWVDLKLIAPSAPGGASC
ncbi:hypothetical protein [Bradyrhizobium sp. LA7.1]|uniref:hypothetical protein n=1 Tax=Bradyrhizobium sp. LA7.1 TaxID=3156324 RepID=UPI003393F866